MSGEQQKLENLERLLALHGRVLDEIVRRGVCTPDEMQEIDIGFRTYLVISTHSHIVEKCGEVVRHMQKKHGWGKKERKRQIRGLNERLSRSVGKEPADSDFAQAVESYGKLTEARNHLAHNDVGKKPLPFEWSGEDVADHCRRALKFPDIFRQYAEKHVRRTRGGRKK